MPEPTEPSPQDRLPEPTSPPGIYRAMAAAMGEVRAVGKWGLNTDQGYKFRSIDHFMDALNPAMSKHGVIVVPTVLSRLTDERQTRSGGRMRLVDMEVAFDFYGPDGSSVRAVTWGEGTDTSDKATNKAMTGAFKYAIMQTFMVPTVDLRDSDVDSPQPPSREESEAAAAAEASPRKRTRKDAAPAPSEHPADAAPAPQTEELSPRATELMSGAAAVTSEVLLRNIYNRAVAEKVLQARGRHPATGEPTVLDAYLRARKAELAAAAWKEGSSS